MIKVPIDKNALRDWEGVVVTSSPIENGSNVGISKVHDKSPNIVHIDLKTQCFNIYVWMPSACKNTNRCAHIHVQHFLIHILLHLAAISESPFEYFQCWAFLSRPLFNFHQKTKLQERSDEDEIKFEKAAHKLNKWFPLTFIGSSQRTPPVRGIDCIQKDSLISSSLFKNFICKRMILTKYHHGKLFGNA